VLGQLLIGDGTGGTVRLADRHAAIDVEEAAAIGSMSAQPALGFSRTFFSTRRGVSRRILF